MKEISLQKDCVSNNSALINVNMYSCTKSNVHSIDRGGNSVELLLHSDPYSEIQKELDVISIHAEDALENI